VAAEPVEPLMPSFEGGKLQNLRGLSNCGTRLVLDNSVFLCDNDVCVYCSKHVYSLANGLSEEVRSGFPPFILTCSKRFKEAVVQVLSTGQQVKHQQYGLGIVTESDTERTLIDFDDHGRKLFVTSLMNAELIGDAPVNPARPKRRSRKTTRRS